MSIGALYCVYENSGYLQESIRRVYDQMDKIIVLLNYKPWNGMGNDLIVEDTYKQVKGIFDPDSKIVLVSQYWESEAEQRNFGKVMLHESGIKWCFTIDDDELYNYDQVEKTKKFLETTDKFVILIPQRVYWKTPEFCIENSVIAFPALCLADPNKTTFSVARNTVVNGGNWETLPPETITCHHYSYVRTDAQLKRKIETFSHATDYSFKEWYEEVWKKWHLGMENLHPNPANKESFKKAVPASQMGSLLEPSGCYPKSSLEFYLRKSDFEKTDFEFSEISNPEKYKFLTKLLQSVYPDEVYSSGGFVFNGILSHLQQLDKSRYTTISDESKYGNVYYLNSKCSKESATKIYQHCTDGNNMAHKLVILDGDIPTNPDFFECLSKNKPFIRLRKNNLKLVYTGENL